MMTTIEEFNKWLERPEGLHLEFKEAKAEWSDKHAIEDYCAALSNEGGGKLIFGVRNNGDVVGTNAFSGTYNKLSNDLMVKIGIRIDVEELKHPDGRVLIFHVSNHYIGKPIKHKGIYWMRAGESLTAMDEKTLSNKLNEANPDFSCQIVKDLGVSDLEETALENFKRLWAKKAQREDYLSFTNDKMLRAIGLLSDSGLNYASLILFGKKSKIDQFLACSEIIFEWRQDPRKTPYDFRINWREPFFKIYDLVWETINVRNLRFPFQEGLFQREVYAFSEKPIREALLNAVTHRDYTLNSQSIFIMASPEEFVIESPGGFPAGITLDNVLFKKAWRNRCIAETFEKAGLVERSGQGMDDIFGNTIREGKGMPDLSEDSFSVKLKIPAQVKDKNFILFLEKVAKEKQFPLSFEEIYELEKIRENKKFGNLKFKNKFLELGIIEQVGRTSGARYILSHKYYVFEGKIGKHTRLTGIPREKEKEFILKHLEKNEKGFMKDFKDIFPELKMMDISNLLQELKATRIIEHVGSSRNGYWKLQK
ncbi:MAG: putative DNA binding domain-containing protein [bacterium]|nr:putative DNA binding domain-containing protein [bacterium]